MIRREARLRREYIYRKSLEEKQRATEEKRQKVVAAVESNKAIPNDLKKDALALQNGADWGGQVNEIDDEYRWAGATDPKVVITTSHDPSSSLKVFSKEMKLVFPNAQRINRGKADIRHICQACKANDVTDLIIFHETSGKPDGMIVCHLPFGPTTYFNISNVVMRHDIENHGKVSEAYPHLIFHNMDTKLGLRITKVLKHLFPVPKPESKRVMTFANNDDFISFRHHVYKKGTDGSFELTEVGPRFEIRPYCIKLGTLENIKAAEDEWVLRNFMRTSHKRQWLSSGKNEDDFEEIPDI
ncbi:unnamed protein product, partial [Mesorhabditis belari]|uniref:Brix domain-containing protein n=1 Tax=Mesorhabditis belari TaxID=2138241 RepID=A0AAF3FEP8_9BILA